MSRAFQDLEDPEASSAEDDAESVEGNETSELKLPTSMKVPAGNGQVATVPIDAPESVSIMCGLPAPPGGWYGPFGFFRIGSYVFAALAVLGLILAAVATFALLASAAKGGQNIPGDTTVPLRANATTPATVSEEAWAISAALILALGAALSGSAAYAHEGLAKQVNLLADQNAAFAEKNERFAAQVKSLSPIQDQLNQAQSSMGIGMDKLETTIATFHSLETTNQLLSMLRAFMDADGQHRGEGVGDRVLQGAEVHNFFHSCQHKLQEAAPDYDLSALEALAAEKSMGMGDLRLLVNAVVAGSEKVIGKSSAMLNLVCFGMDPEAYSDRLTKSLQLVLRDDSPEELQSLVEEKAEEADGNRIPAEELQDVSARIMAVGRTSSSA
eukprot:TRINITY_DN67117_c0_g1_i1.p1 TRINITY_DN67117_c0_g1~~TRINITY_DN67117_c0_g1_i1.p1  ORF type:complete len:430 (+),score=119.22 TRINITY_DN67117_c0_g1_i1:137-1291(+)